MLRKKLGAEAIETNWSFFGPRMNNYFKISSTLIILEGCVRIGDDTFDSCKNLKEVSIPKSVEEVGERAFRECKKLEKVEIPESVKMIRRAAFCGCQEATIILKKPENDFEEINDSAFVGCKDVKEEIIY